jgi:hypothetical protein
MKKLFLLLIVSLILAVSSFAQKGMKFSKDYSQSALQIGVGPVLSSMEGFGAGAFVKWHHLSVGYTHTFSDKYATPSINIGVIGLPFCKDTKKLFSPFVSFDGRFGVRVSGVVDGRTIGDENLKLVCAGGPGIGFPIGPVVLSAKVDFGCQFAPSNSAHPEWRVGVLFSLFLNFSDFGKKK